MFSNYVESGAPLMTDPTLKERANFTLSPSHVTLANSLVRVIQCKVKTVGFRTEPPEESEVKISANTTPLPNEMLAHRIGMIPIAIIDVDEFDPALYKVELEITNNTQEVMPVTTENFKIFVQDSEGYKPVNTKSWFPADGITKDHILITNLRPQWTSDGAEKIVLHAKPCVSTGEENIRYSPVCSISYGHTIDPDVARQEKFFQDWLLESKKIKDTAQTNPTNLTNLKREWNLLEKQRCFLVNEKNEPYSFDFEIETNGIFSVPTVVYHGIRELKKIIQKYETLETVLPANVEIRPTQSARLGVDVIFRGGEDHTLGNLLQTYLVERHIEGGVGPGITYAAYRIPHPLKKELIVEIGAEKDVEQTARKAIVAVVRFLLGELDKMEAEWLTLTAPESRPVPATPQSSRNESSRDTNATSRGSNASASEVELVIPAEAESAPVASATNVAALPPANKRGRGRPRNV